MDAGIDILGSLTGDAASASLWLKEIQFKKSNLCDFQGTNPLSLKNKYVFLKPHNTMNGDVQSNGFTKEVSSKGHSSKTEEDTENIKDPKYSLFNASDVVLEWKPSMNPIGPGLANLGNTCFMNSVLQCLTYCPPLVNYLLFNDNPHSKQMCLNFCMACMLSKHIKQCHSRKMHQTVSPDDISRRRKSISKNFTYGSQEDAHEFLRQVLDLMCRNTVTAFENRRGFKLDSASKETTAFNRIFGGYLRSQVTCRFCKHKSNTYDHIMDFMLEVKGVDTLYEAFDKFTKTETLSNENAYECPKCKKKVPVTKKFTIHRPPNVATIQLKRFQFSSFSSFGSGKIDRHIKFPETLDLQDYLSDRSSQTALYSLSAVLVHQGFTCNSGHYYAFVKHSSGSWYLMNDHLVKQVNLGYVLNEKAYILFYTRRRNSASPRKSISSFTSSAVSSTTPQIGPKVITDKLTNGSSTMIGPQLPNGALLSSSVTSLDSNGSSSSTPAKTSILKASTVTYSNHTPKIIPDSSSILKTSTSKIMSNKPNNNASVTQTKTTESNSNSIKTTLDRPTIPSFKIVPRSQIILQKALATQEKKNANGLSNGSLVNGNHKILDKDSTPRKIVGYDDSSDSEEEEVFPHKQSKIGGRHLMGVGMFLNQQPKLSDPSKSHEVFLPMSPEKSSDDFRLFSSSPLSEKKVRENPRKDQSNSSNSVQDSTINSKENGKKSNEPKEVPPTEPVNSAGNSSPNRAVETTKSITESSLPINIHEKKKHQDNGLPSKLQEKKNDFVNQLTKSMYSKDSGRKSNANNAPLNASSADSSRTGMTMDSTTEQSLTSLGKNVTTWDGDTNHVDQTSLAEKRSNPRYDDSDDEYNAEFDQGKVKKVKKPKTELHSNGENPFEKYKKFVNPGHGDSVYSEKSSFTFNRQGGLKTYGTNHWKPNFHHKSHHKHHRSDERPSSSHDRHHSHDRRDNRFKHHNNRHRDQRRSM